MNIVMISGAALVLRDIALRNNVVQTREYQTICQAEAVSTSHSAAAQCSSAARQGECGQPCTWARPIVLVRLTGWFSAASRQPRTSHVPRDHAAHDMIIRV